MSYEPQRRMVISTLWLQASLLTFVVGFTGVASCILSAVFFPTEYMAGSSA
ncbi:MAG: hypothetical protein GX774_08790 [Armatimonadetes bacterium]|nr:hypothetical protein [Armatimonadota bacterium]